MEENSSEESFCLAPPDGDTQNLTAPFNSKTRSCVHRLYQNMADPRRSERLSDGEIEDEEVYCICRTSDTKRFMIGCDQCDEWFHGDCINITEDHAKTIKKFFCFKCREEDPSLQTVYKEKKRKMQSKPLEEKRNRRGEEEEDPSFRISPESDDDFSDSKRRSGNGGTGGGSCGGTGGAGHGGKRKSSKKSKQSSRPVKRSKPERSGTKRIETGGRGGSSSRRFREHPDHHFEKVRQCYGPECINAARRGSKYCCDECGLKVAKNRILEILPQRIKQWQSSPSVADELSSRALDKIRQEQEEAKKRLEELDMEQEALERLIEEAKGTNPFTEEEEEDYDERLDAESDLTVYCVTCGHEVNTKVAPRHMEKCFNKYESQTSLGSVFKTKIDNLFCDTFNGQSKTYCKRLRVLCPEHSKDPKVREEEVCGFPLVASESLFSESGSFCRAHKKKCTKHLGWEKLRRALIDMERVRQWLRIDELFEKEQKTRFLMANRGGLLALMLHQTIAAPSSSH